MVEEEDLSYIKRSKWFDIKSNSTLCFSNNMKTLIEGGHFQGEEVKYNYKGSNHDSYV